MFYRQQFDGPLSHDGNNPGGTHRGSWKTAVIGIAIGVGMILVALVAFVLLRIRRRRRQNAYKPANAQGGFDIRPPSQVMPPSSKEDTVGLLAGSAPPAIVAWDADHVQAGSTQDGWGIQRPASAASLNSNPPPPRYEEATTGVARPSGHGRHQSDSGLRPLLLAQGGEAASYYNDTAAAAARDMEQEQQGRGRSVSRERRLSVNARGTTGNRDRARSVSRFREEGMVDLGLNSPVSTRL